jgi:ABC-2 type transport system permease protein
MRDLFLLLSPRFLGIRNRLSRSGRQGKKKGMVMVGLGLGFCAGMSILFCRVLLYFQSVEIIGDLLARHLLSMVLLIFFSLLVFSHIITALSNLYLSKDLELCHAAPVEVEELFLSRAAYSFMDGSWMLIIFGAPIFVAYAYVYRPEPVFYFTVIHINLAMAIIASGIGILVTMILVYVFPAQRTRDLIMLLSIFIIVTLYLLFRFLRPEKLVNPDAFFSVLQYMSALKAPDSPYLPTQWVTEALWTKLTASGGKGIWFEVLLTWTTAASVVVINVWVSRAVYFDGFSKSQEAKRRRPGGKKLLDLAANILTRPFKSDLAALFAKDIKTFFRDNAQWSQLLLLGALVVVYLYNFSVLPLDKSPIRLDFLQNELAFLNMGLAGFVLSAVAARFVFTSISAEGEAYWILKSSPLIPERYLWSKYLFFLLPMLVLAEILIVFTNHLLDVTGFMMLLSSITMFFMVFGIVALGVGLGALYPRFRYENVAQVSTGFGGVLFMILSATYIGLVIVLEAGPVYILFLSGIRGTTVTLWQWVFIICSFAAVLAINSFVVYEPMKMGLKALRDHG